MRLQGVVDGADQVAGAVEQRAQGRHGERRPEAQERPLLAPQGHCVEALVDTDLGVEGRPVAATLHDLVDGGRRRDEALGRGALFA